MVNSNTPLVSVVIPVYNGERFLIDAIDSVLGQSYTNIEIIVVDDGSTDGTAAILKKYAKRGHIISLTHEKRQNLGVSRSRKLGVNEAKGDYIAFLDADDMFLPDKVARQVSALEEHPDVILCHHDVELLSESDKGHISRNRFRLAKERYLYELHKEPDYLIKNNISNPTVMVRAEYLRKLSYSFNQLFQFEDWLMWVLLGELGSFLYLPDKLAYYRFHSESATADVVSNPLVWHFSTLEFLLCVISRLKDEPQRHKAFIRLQSTIINLFMEYIAGSNLSDEEVLQLVTEFKQQLFTTTSDGVDDATATWSSKNLAQRVPVERLGLAIALKAVYQLKGD